VLERAGGPPPYARILEQYRPVVRSLEEELVGDFATPLWILLGTMGIVLLIACANVANLLLVRAESRDRDLAVRSALGAGRGRLVAGLMSEALILAMVGGAAGMVLAWAALPLVVRAAPESIPRLGEVHRRRRAALHGRPRLVAALVAGILPALRFSKPDVANGLRSSQRTGSAASPVTRNALIVVQTAAALVLLVGSGLLLQSFRALRSVDPGYETREHLHLPDGAGSGAVRARGRAVLRPVPLHVHGPLAALPGVESVGLVNTLPLDEGAGERACRDVRLQRARPRTRLASA
jgi:putative ABC transport system permease protein